MNEITPTPDPVNHNFTSYEPVNRLPDEPPPKPKNKLGENWKSIASTLAIIVVAPLIALILTLFVFQSYEVDGPSMETTLQNSDRLIVYKVPRTWARITGHAYIPKRGDIIIFSKSENYEFGANSKKQLIKRVIGLPGDRVVVKDGVVTLYNAQKPDGFNPDNLYPYGKVIVTTPGTVDVTVGKDEVFVAGDNRPNSLDSRSFGAISANDIIGKLVLRVYPLSKAEKF